MTHAASLRHDAPPCDHLAEEAILSAILYDERAFPRAVEIVDVDAFYVEKHRRVFRAMVTLAGCGVRIDPITLADHLSGRGELESVGGKGYLGDLTSSVPTWENVQFHALIVREKADRRRLIQVAQEAMQAAWSTNTPVRDIAAALQSAALPLAIHEGRDGFVRVKADLHDVLESIEAAARGDHQRRVIPTGYREIDDKIAGGFERGHLIFLAGVPGSAKTGVALNFAINAATAAQPIGVLFVSAEMTRHQLIKRALANLGEIPLSNVRSGKLADEDYPRLARGAGMLIGAPLWTDQTPTPTIEDVVAKCRAKKSEFPDIGLVLVDFIQLVQKQHDERRTSDVNRSAELSAISYGLQALAKELDVAVIATSQVDASGIENRPDKRPQLRDFRWSQAMREAAHLIATVFRPQMYDSTADNTIELSFQKGRDDPPFAATFDWIGQHMRLRSRAPQWGQSALDV